MEKPKIKPGDLIKETVENDEIYIYIVKETLKNKNIMTSKYLYIDKRYRNPILHIDKRLHIIIHNRPECLSPRSFEYQIIKRNATEEDWEKMVFMVKTGIL